MRQWFDKIKEYLRFRFLLTASNPRNFEEFWNLQLSRSQLFSAILALLIIGGFLVSIIFGGLFSEGTFGGLSGTQQEEMLAMRSKLEKLTTQSRQQELYLENLQKVLKGDVSSDSLKMMADAKIVDPKSIDTSRSVVERHLAQKVGKQLGSTEALYRIKSPITDVTVTEKFQLKRHPYISIKPPFRTPLFAFAEGVVLVGAESKSTSLVLTFEGGIVVTFRNLGEVNIPEGNRTKIGEILAYTKKDQVVEIEIRKGETPVNPSEVFDFNTVKDGSPATSKD